MQEEYTCLCGGKHWTIKDDNTITCPHCGRIFELHYDHEHLESADQFYLRIRREG